MAASPRSASCSASDHFSVEGSGATVRGLTYVRSEFNGREAFSALNDRSLGFQDVPSELLGGVDVFKSPTADRIEGGISGIVNLRTRKPFDSSGTFLAGTLENNYGDFVERSAPTASVVGSARWETGIGDVGILGSFVYSQLFSRSDRLQVSSFRNRPIFTDGARTDVVAFDGATQQGSGLFPRGAVMGSDERNRERYGYAAALQWRSTDGSMEAAFQFLRSDARLAWTENVNVIFYYGSTLWQLAGFTESDSLLINIVSGAVSIAACFVTIALVDRIGRKPLLLIGSAGMTAALFVMVYAFSQGTLDAEGSLVLSQGLGTVAVVATNLYVIFFNVSWGPIMWVMLGEMFPNQIRGSALAVCGFAQWFSNYLIAQTFPIMAVGIGLAASYSFYGACALVSFFLVQRFIHETKGVELEAMRG